MNKTELIDHIAQRADISKAAAGRALEALVAAIRTTLKKGESVTLVGFGTFHVGKRAVALGAQSAHRRSQSRSRPRKVPKFRPGKALKDALN